MTCIASEMLALEAIPRGWNKALRRLVVLASPESGVRLVWGRLALAILRRSPNPTTRIFCLLE